MTAASPEDRETVPTQTGRIPVQDSAGPRPAKVAVLGAGSWGTAFAKIAADAAAASEDPWPVVLWGRDEASMAAMAEHRINEKYFPGIVLPENLDFTADGAAALAGADVVVLALPAQILREQLGRMVSWLEPEAVLVSLAKGLERGTELRMSQVLSEVVPGSEERIAVVSGPNLAREIIQGEPTASVVASSSARTAELVSLACATDTFRPYTSTDVVGVEIGGLAKNVIALCVGICDGRGFGDNSKASVMTRGLAETTRLAIALGGRPETMAGLAGMGDLVATCSSPLSRNHTAGRLLATGLTAEEVTARTAQTAEGMKSAPVVLDLARSHGVEMPITEAVTAILDRRIRADQLQTVLLGRRLKAEVPHRDHGSDASGPASA